MTKYLTAALPSGMSVVFQQFCREGADIPTRVVEVRNESGTVRTELLDGTGESTYSCLRRLQGQIAKLKISNSQS